MKSQITPQEASDLWHLIHRARHKIDGTDFHHVRVAIAEHCTDWWKLQEKQ